MKLPLDIAKHPPEGVLTIAHRGGVVGNGAHENSRLAIEAAIERGYDLVELDVTSTTDHHPILVHGAWRVCEEGESEPYYEVTFHDKTLAEARKARHPWNDETVLTLAAGLELCRGHLGVMLDFQMPGRDPVFYERVSEAIDVNGFANKLVTISKEVPGVRECLGERALYAIGPDEIEPLAARWALGPQYFGFVLPDLPPGARMDDARAGMRVSEQGMARFHDFGLPVVMAINTFQYLSAYTDARETHQARAQRDIERFRVAGVDGFQVDSAYDHALFGQ